MSIINHNSRLKIITRWLPGLIISTIAILLLIRFSNWAEVLEVISGIKLAWVLPAVVFFLISVLIRAASWMIILQNKVNYGRVFLTLNEGYLLNNIFPFRLGELGRAYILSQTTILSGFFVLSTIFIERTYDVAIAAGLFLATIPYVFSLEAGQSIALLVFIIGIFALLTMYLLARNHNHIKKFMENVTEGKLFLHDRIVPKIGSLLEGLGIFTSFGQFGLSLGLILISWIFGGLELFFLSKSFGVDLELWMLGFVLGMTSLGIAIPSAPAGLGVFEAAAVGAFSLMGLSTSTGLAIAFVSHFISIFLTGLIGMYGIFKDGESITGLYQQLRNLRVFN